MTDYIFLMHNDAIREEVLGTVPANTRAERTFPRRQRNATTESEVYRA